MIYPLGGSLSNPGEMIILNNLLLISCKYSGIAIYDITDPNNVIQEAYISIPGHFRMIERDGIIWADSYTDLVVIDPKEGRNCELLWIVKDILPYDPLDLLHGIYTEYTSHEVPDPQEGIVIHWQLNVKKRRQWLMAGAKINPDQTENSFLHSYPLRFDYTDNTLVTIWDRGIRTYEINLESKSIGPPMEHSLQENYIIHTGESNSQLTMQALNNKSDSVTFNFNDSNRILAMSEQENLLYIVLEDNSPLSKSIILESYSYNNILGFKRISQSTLMRFRR
ncbi:MAG: hypothetical protein PF447_04120 [Spirochaetaceae bacterium]|nr:hypothetical protein [Spirochaetaceae bacterium]